MGWSRPALVWGGWVMIVGSALALASYGCGDDGDGGTGGTGATTGTGGGGATGGTGGEGGAEVASITFIAVEIEQGGAKLPLEGATVAFDAPGGQRVEEATGADGRVTFDGVDWSLGQAAATAYLPDRMLSSVVNLDEAVLGQIFLIDGAVPLPMAVLTSTTPETATVSGTATGLQDQGHRLVVNVVGILGGSEWSGAGDGTWTVAVPTGEPFVIQGVEGDNVTTLPSGQGYDRAIHQVAHQSHGAITDDTTGVVLDFGANALATQTADVSFSLPSRADSPVRDGWPYSFVCASNSRYCFGWPTHIDVSTDGNQFDVSLLWVEPTWAEDVVTSCQVNDGNRLLALNNVPGYPQTGNLGLIPDVPAWTTPASSTAPHPLHEPIAWEQYEADVPISTLSLIRTGGRAVWQIAAGANTTSLTIPAPPSPVDTAALLGTTFLGGQLTGGTVDWDAWAWTRYANAESILVQP